MNNEIKIGYKVVLNRDGKLMSGSVDTAKVEYAKGIMTKPRLFTGPLTVFTSKFLAIGFIAQLSDANRPIAEVHKCNYETTSCQTVFRVKDCMIDSKPLSELPHGTALAKNVTLTELTFKS